MAADDAVAAAPVAGSDADPTAPLSPIETWRKIEQDLDSKTALPVETRDCWLYGIYKKLPGAPGSRSSAVLLVSVWSVPASFGDAKGPD